MASAQHTQRLNQLTNAITASRNDIQHLSEQLKTERLGRMGDITLPTCKEGKESNSIAETQIKERKLLRGHFGKVYALQWCNGETHEQLVSASQDGKLIVWNGLTGNKTKLIPLSSAWVMTVAFSASSNLVACGGLDNICSGFKLAEHGIPDEKTEAATPNWELQHHDGYLSCCRFLDDTTMLTCSGDSLCILWDINVQKPRTIFEGHDSDVMSLTPLQNNTFVSGGVDCTAKVWDIRTGKCTQTHTGHDSDINSIDRFPEGYSFATGSDDNSARMFDTRCWGEINTFANPRVLVSLTSVAFSYSGRFLFGGYDDFACRAWDVIKGTLVEQALQGHDKRVSCLGVNVRGGALATGSWDDTLKIWA